ncbi:TolB family protein [Pseudoalteromonas obscura]|uniref:Uncharacterized protein n=1 Tax=Pseudoalteromonas obscura TaxID=3048491 RepID=A0ABT7ET31_9GAMM|nr:hypothetical protein [Pseudoalteromonas sp. P94(2023)]MDK2598215.1 hypothetical protein [Pseudoalteromonas sp. P94(2023)]
MRARIQLILMTFVWLFATPSQAEKSDWKTIQSPHFRVHYQRPYKVWAEASVKELERVRSQVLSQQGRALEAIIDAIVIDPFNLPNGFALPSSDSPFMALYVTPPQSDTAIAHNPSWLKLLVLHEYIHLVHLSQPSRYRARQWLRDMSDSFDLANAVLPRWVAEGYATLQESKLTGQGRLYDNYSEALLQTFARQGALLPYHALSHGDGSLRASAMAYLLGARFLAWLEQEYDEATLDAVWTRVNAVESRNFEVAFHGAFGKSAIQLYRRFIAEYTHQAIQSASQRTELEQYEFMQFAFAARDIQLSSDKKQFLAVETTQSGQVSLVVYASEKNHKAVEQFEQRQAAILARDPDDIPDTHPASFRHKKLATLEAMDFNGIYHPQWLDEETVYFVARQRVEHGWANALFKWHIPTDKVTRLSNSIGIRRFSIINEFLVIAERTEHGFSQLVQISLSDQQVIPLFSRDLNSVYDHPVISPSGKQLAYLKAAQGRGWRLYVTDLADSTLVGKEVPLLDDSQYVASPRWDKTGVGIYFVMGRKGALGIYHYHLQRDELKQISDAEHVFEEILGEVNNQLLFLESTPYGSKLMAISNWHTHAQQVAVFDTQGIVQNDNKQKTQALPIGFAQTVADYDPTLQDWSLAVSVQGALASTEVLSVGITGADILKHWSWQAGMSQSLFDDVLQGGYLDMAYRWGEFDVRNELKVSELDTSVQRDELGGFQAVQKAWSNTLEVSFAQHSQKWRWRPYVGWHMVEQRYQGLEHSYWAGNQVSYHHDQQQYSVDVTMDGAKIWGYNAGHEVMFKGAVTLWQWPMYINVSNRYRTEQALSVGGFATNSIYSGVGGDQQHVAELPFMFKSGAHYLGYEFATSWRAGQPRLFYARHQMDSQNFAKSWGIKWQMNLSQKVLGSAAKYAPAGISNMHLDVGFSRLSRDTQEDEWRTWFGLWHPW